MRWSGTVGVAMFWDVVCTSVWVPREHETGMEGTGE